MDFDDFYFVRIIVLELKTDSNFHLCIVLLFLILLRIYGLYEAVGTHFLDPLLRTGSGDIGENRDVYLQLSVTVLAAFCRVPEIASSVEMVSRIPLILEIMSKRTTTNILEECYELLYLVSTAYEAGVMALIKYGGLRVIAPQMSDLPDGSHAMEVAIKILQLLVSKLSSESMTIERLFELSLVKHNTDLITRNRTGVLHL